MNRRTLESPATAVRRQETTARALVEEALARLDTERELNAFITLIGEAALAEADPIDAKVGAGEEVGLLAGVPVVVKDNIDVAGVLKTARTPAIHYVPERSAPIVERLTAAGAIVVGKTNMHELAFGVTSNDVAFGAVKNPADRSRFPGGSSGGTAAAIAAGIVAGGLGTDTAGSVRVPAALTGIAGLRPTTNAVAAGGIVPSVAAFDVAGPMGVSVGDCALLYAVMTQSAPARQRSLKGLRLAVAEPFVSGLSETTAAAVDRAVKTLEEAGVEITNVNLSALVDASFEAGNPIGYFEMRSVMTAYLAAHMPSVDLETLVEKIASPDVKSVYVDSVIGANAPSDADYRAGLERLPAIRRDYLAALDAAGVDGLIFPSAPLEAQSIEGAADTVMLDGAEVPTLQAYLRNVVVTSVVGAPGLTLPLPVAKGALPVGLELDGRPGDDADVLAIALALEAALAG